MPKFKVLIGDKGKTYTQEVSDQQAASLIGLKLGATFKGDTIGLGGYELQITGGSDTDGFPMKKGLHGPASRKILMSPGVGFNSNVHGIKKKKRIRGDTISENTSQVNTKIITAGPSALDKLIAPPKEKGAEGEGGDAAPTGTKPEGKPEPAPDKPAEAPAEAPAEEKPPEEKKEDKPAEEKKEKPTKEDKKEAPKSESPAEEKPPEEKPAEEKPAEKPEDKKEDKA